MSALRLSGPIGWGPHTRERVTGRARRTNCCLLSSGALHTLYRAGPEVSWGSRRASALLAARTSSHEPSRCQSILLVMLLDARSSPAARARTNRSAQWHQRTSAQTLSATTRWLPHVDVTSNIERRTTLARGTKPVPTAEAPAMQRCSCSCSRQQLRHHCSCCRHAWSSSVEGSQV